MMKRTLVFDMDGTIANFYGVSNWLEDIRNGNPRPYIVAEPLYDMEILNAILNLLKLQGWTIAVTSWLAKGSDKEFDELTRIAKREWLARYDFPFDEIHLVSYGTPKSTCTEHLGGIQFLFDDNADVRREWESKANRFSVDATQNIMEKLVDLLFA